MKRKLAMTLAVFLLSGDLFAAEAEARRFDVAPEIVFYTGDTLRKSVLGGLNLTWRVAEPWWLTAGARVGQASVDEGSGVDVEDGDLFLLFDAGVNYNLAVRMGSGPDAWPADLYTTFGLGYLRYGGVRAWAGVVGGGMVIHTPRRWLSFRADVKSFLYSASNSNGSDFNGDVTFALGPSFGF